jgi:transcriptional regulator with XRE-family HTH domain
VSSASLGNLIKDLRQSRSWSQTDLADVLCRVSGRPTIGREEVHRWETGKIIPGKFWLTYLAQVFDMPLDVLTSQAKLSRMNRRAFMSLSALTVAHGKLASEVVASIAQSDFGLLTKVQTTHGTDLVTASFADYSVRRRLRTWMHDGDSPILRVNAAGILAKVPDEDTAEQVATVLTGDPETRELYTTAVIARVGALPWATAAKIASKQIRPTVKQANFLASRFASEALNPRDAGARWCSAAMLRDLSPYLGPGQA